MPLPSVLSGMADKDIFMTSIIHAPRKSFGRSPVQRSMPDLIAVQKHSYEGFLQKNIPQEKRENRGMQAVFSSVFPIRDFGERAELQFVSYCLEEPKYSVVECQQRGMTYASLLKVTLRLVVWDVDEETGARTVHDIKEQSVYMGDVPLMTRQGTFIINGTNRVVVSQMHRSPGVFFDHDRGKTHASGKFLYLARVIPYRGSWVDFEFDAKDLIYVRIDRRRKILVSTLLMALCAEDAAPFDSEGDADDVAGAMSRQDILQQFYHHSIWKKVKGGWQVDYNPDRYAERKVAGDLVDAASGEVVFAADKKMSAQQAIDLKKNGLKKLFFTDDDIHDRFIADDRINETSGEIYCEAGDLVDADLLDTLDKAGIKKIAILDIDYVNEGPYLRNTLAADKNMSRKEALFEIYRVMRPGEPPTIETAEILFRNLFFKPQRYDLSEVGRFKLNARLALECADDVGVLRKDDILAIVKALIAVRDGRDRIDDIDHLSNRRVRSVGELMENQYRTGLLRMERAIRERMSSAEIGTIMPNDLVNAKPVSAAVREFFGASQLSQFMDQTNPLAEVTHKRRLSALGPGGLTRERAGFEVRDVHPSHYGRICPIETPEGPNIGLINSLATYASINRYGFIETPYVKVNKGKVSQDVVYLSAIEEGRRTIAQANAEIDEKGYLKDDLVPCRRNHEFMIAPSKEVEFMDVSARQLVSVAASLIPFLENDDANRALMGSNMQRQAVPLLRVQEPFVGTGMEEVVARDSGAAIVAEHDGIVDRVDAGRIVLRLLGEGDDSGVKIHNLIKFQRSNQGTCINQKPLVHRGQKVRKGDIIADGPSTRRGELALGRNVLAAFMSWDGYNFEDSILISERLVSDDIFTSVHIEEFDVMARDTKLGEEQITRDIPNVGEEALSHLDEVGVVHVGATVKAGDVLVGKVTPKGESPMTPEEKLLRAIFGEKASEVRDSSLRVPPGVVGTVIEVRVFSRQGIEKDERSLVSENVEVERATKDRDDERVILERSFNNALRDMLVGQTVAVGQGKLRKGANIDMAGLDRIESHLWRKIKVVDKSVTLALETLRQRFQASIDDLEQRYENQMTKLAAGDELMPGVMKMIKVFLAVKRKLQPGDKMAGRHGNKGVISRIVPVEDMPYTEDGIPIDIVLNPLGVPSRMNLGQVMETHLGWAAAEMGRKIGEMVDACRVADGKTEALESTLREVYGSQLPAKMSDNAVRSVADDARAGIRFAAPVFEGARESDINDALKRAGCHTSGQVRLVDGRTGEFLERPVTVGNIYMLKLHHLVDDKIHARSIGPYSLVTQQPLGGKAQFGGQRFGEMEVWALEAYGAAYTLQEMLTVKSDDVAGRTRAYETIVRGEDNFEVGVPESFNVLVMELRSLGINVELRESHD